MRFIPLVATLTTLAVVPASAQSAIPAALTRGPAKARPAYRSPARPMYRTVSSPPWPHKGGWPRWS
jgi:hypothetical protein